MYLNKRFFVEAFYTNLKGRDPLIKVNFTTSLTAYIANIYLQPSLRLTQVKYVNFNIQGYSKAASDVFNYPRRVYSDSLIRLYPPVQAPDVSF